MAIAVYARSCSRNTPGNSKIFLTEVASMTGFTVAGGVVTAVTPNSTARFHQYGADLDTVQMTSEGKGGPTYVQTQNLIFKLSKKNAAMITALDAIRDAVPCGLLAIRQDSNGQCFLMGWSDTSKNGRPFTKMTDTFDSGTKPDDEGANSCTVTLTRMGSDDEIPFDATLTTAILTASVTATAFITY